MRFYIGYENDIGKIEMGTKPPYIIREIEGLEQVNASRKAIRYVGVAGEKTLEKSPNPRIITIDGRVTGEGRRFYTDQLAMVFDNTVEGILKLNVWGKLRRIKCIPNTVAFGKMNKSYLDFIITLSCDNPYFRDWENSTVSLYSRQNNLFSGMTFPRVFTFRTSRGNAINNGNANIEPVIHITAGELGEGTDVGLTITNETTGAIIDLDYGPEDGEKITIDIENRNIISNINGDITRYKSKFTLLSDFVLTKGNNIIRFDNANAGQTLAAEIEYSNLYTEGVY